MADEDCEEIICRDNPLGNLRKNLSHFRSQQECPLDKQQLGRYSWSVLHTFAAYYPQNPSNEDKQNMKGLLLGFKNLYPCRHCRLHFQKEYERDPPQLDNQKDFSLWVCRQHNYVNKILGKSQYKCDYQKLMQRWKTGCNNDQL